MFTSFADLISGMSHGETDTIATRDMKALVSEMQNLANTMGGKQKGQVTVKVSFALERGALDTTAEVTVKHPPKVRPRAFLYAMKDGSLSEEDTRQGRLDLSDAKDVSTPGVATVRDIGDRRMAAANDKT